MNELIQAFILGLFKNAVSTAVVI